MRTLSLIATGFLAASSVLAQAPAPPAPAPAAPGGALNPEQEMEQMFNDAQSSFNKGQYDVALQKLGAFHAKTNNKEFPQILFLEGACHFNLKQFDKAASFFEQFVTKFPTEGAMNDALMALGESYLNAGMAEKGIEALKKAAAVDELRDRAGLMIANHYKKAGQADDALQILEVVLKDQSGAPTQEQQQAILMASDIYVGKGDSDKAAEMMNKLRSGTSGAEGIVELNILSQKVGDSMLEANRFGEALRAYQSMRRHSELIRLQKERVAVIEGWIARLAAGGRVQFMGKLLQKEEADGLLATNKKVLEDIEAVKDYDANIFYRLGQCFFEMKRFHEAILAFKYIYDNFKDFPGRDGALYGMIAANQQIERPARAYILCEEYMKSFPDGKFIIEVTSMFGALAFESGNLKAAEDSLRRVVATVKDKDQKVSLTFMLGVVQFEGQSFGASRDTFKALISEHKDAVQRPAAQYYVALTYFFENNSKETRRALRDYIAANPKGEYVVDARYRLAFIEVQAPPGEGNVTEALADLEKLTEEYPNDPNIGQVWSLLGDIYGQRQATEDEAKKGVDYVVKSMTAYRNAVDKAKTPDVQNYAIENATNLMVEKGMWKDLSEMWGAYYTGRKGQPEALKAIYWITRAKERESKELASQGKTAEAKEAELAARKLVASEMAPHLGNPANEQVEVLIQQLVTMMVPKRRPRAVVPAAAPPTPPAAPAAGAPAADGAAAAAAPPADGAAATAAAPPAAPAAPVVAAAPPAAPVQTFEEIEAEFKTLVTPEAGVPVNGTASARILYGRAMIARLMKDVPKYENLINLIPDAAKAEELSPLLLATLADLLLKKGDADKAGQFYEQIRAKYPNSEFGDRAPIGLAEIAFSKKDYEKALSLFTEAVEKYAENPDSILVGTLGRAKTLLAMKKFDEAKVIYETILNTREWRTAMPAALFGMGQCHEGKGEHAKAADFYRRIIIANRKDKPILAKAYIQAAKCYMQLGKNADARTVLEEMLRQKDITELPEFQEGRELINKVGP